ncbi:MAG TPA: ABC transporter transmembrane domain-containing protein, partial [Bacillales bacterium]|nr:ABC transporter transmembrane domain-containing protein [Bacillales bacterium]
MIKLLRYLKPFRVQVALVLVLIFLQTLANLYLPTLMSDIVDTGIVNGDVAYIIKIGVLMLLIACLGSAFSVTASYCSSRAATGFGRLLRKDLFTHVEHFSMQAFEKIGTASLITRTTNDITQVQQVLSVMLRIMVMAPLMCFGGILMAVSKDAMLSLVLIAVVPVLSLF